MASFGEELRRQRELRSVSLREISDATKINIRFLEALEENDFKHLPGGQFNKGFIRAYARHIGVDGEDMVNAYILEVRRQEDEAPARTATARARLDPADKRALIALAILAAMLVLLVVGVWLVFFHGRKSKGPDAQTRPAHAAKNSAAEPPAGSKEDASRAPSSPADTPFPAGSAPTGGAGASGATSTSGPMPAMPATPATPAPAAAPDGHEARAASAAAAGTEMTLRALPLQSVKFGLLCDGKETFAGTLEPGRPLSFTCAGVYEVSVEDAGAVNLSIDGDRIYVGRPGQSIAGRHVSRANLPDFLNPPYEPAGR